MKIITFIMPSIQPQPSGGYKIVYEYANRLAQDGNVVYIVNPLIRSFWNSNLKSKLKFIYFLFKFQYFQNTKILYTLSINIFFHGVDLNGRFKRNQN